MSCLHLIKKGMILSKHDACLFLWCFKKCLFYIVYGYGLRSTKPLGKNRIQLKMLNFSQLRSFFLFLTLHTYSIILYSELINDVYYQFKTISLQFDYIYVSLCTFNVKLNSSDIILLFFKLRPLQAIFFFLKESY